MGGGMGGATSTNSALVTLLNSAGTKWSAAVVGDQSAAGYILSTNTAVFSIGGWSGSDNNITLAQFKQYVAEGKIHYFISGGGMGAMGGGQQTGSSASPTESASSGTAPTDGGTAPGIPGSSASGGQAGRRTGGMGAMGGALGGSGSSGSASAITSWVTSTFTSRTVGGVTIYDLTSAKS